ncbi:MAG TPA: ester cyclase [Thermoanaerobaculia bacterium]|nr:ester cyclase [Thermoanaerobaculia bacterium]
MDDMETGRTPYAVLSFGGVEGMSDKLFAIPFQSLKLHASYAEGLRAEGNKDLCRRFIQKIFNESELSLIGDFLSPGVVNHELAGALGENSPRGQNIQWMADLIYLYRCAFPDLYVEILDQVAEGEKVVTRLRMRGTQTGDLMTVPASGKEVDITGIRIDRVTDGKIVESWFQLDMFGMLTQIEALPEINRHTRKVAPASRETVPGWRLPAVGLTPAPALPHPAV